jgi:hypothetical protein
MSLALRLLKTGRRAGVWHGRHVLADQQFRGLVSATACDAHDIVGLEHEYIVERNRKQVDFQPLIHNLGLGVRFLQPDDPNAYPLTSGAVLTSDGNEAEVALAPVSVDPGFALTVAKEARAEKTSLLGLLDPAYALHGYSTHLSVRTEGRVGEAVATAFASRFAAPMMLLLDRSTSPGLLVRPRPRRTELCGEYATGAHLAAALVFAVAAVRVCIELVLGRSNCDLDVPKVRTDVVPAVERFGWYIDRSAFGCDLYDRGRHSRLFTVDGLALSAQEVLEHAWAVARPMVADCAMTAELLMVDSVVSGALPLPLEGSIDEPSSVPRQQDPLGGVPGGARAHLLLHPRRRSALGLELAPVMVTWETVIFLVIDDPRRRRAFAVVPRRFLGRFVALLDAGEIDEALADYLRVSRGDRVLSRYEQSTTAGLFDRIVSRRALLPVERDPAEQGAFAAS